MTYGDVGARNEHLMACGCLIYAGCTCEEQATEYSERAYVGVLGKLHATGRELDAARARVADLEAENERLRSDLTYTRIEVDNARRERDEALDALEGENSELAEDLRERIAAVGDHY